MRRNTKSHGAELTKDMHARDLPQRALPCQALCTHAMHMRRGRPTASVDYVHNACLLYTSDAADE